MSGWIKKHGLKGAKYGFVFDALFTRQQKKCAICGVSDQELLEQCADHPEWTRSQNVHYRFNLDHCHWTGRIRGLLCENCNLLLGNVENYGFQEKPEGWPEEDFMRMLENAGRWIEEHQERLFQYMQRDRWLPTKDILVRLQEVS